jgi:hypothetical protein
MKIKEILSEGVAGPKNCWPGYRKTGTQPGTGKNKGKRVNDCEKIKEGESNAMANTASRLASKDDGKVAKLRAAGDKRREDQLKGRDIAKRDTTSKDQWGDLKKEDLQQEFDMIESIIESIADQHAVDAELVWEDLSSLTDDELYVFAVTQPVMEDWQKANKKDKTDGMSQKAVNAYRRENPGSKLKTAVTTKPGKLKKGSKASKRRSSYCSRSAGQQKMHNISCSKTPDKAICKARRRWNC